VITVIPVVSDYEERERNGGRIKGRQGQHKNEGRLKIFKVNWNMLPLKYNYLLI
jgi:hypothetical protein